MFDELNKAIELEPNRESYTLLMKAYESRGMQPEADEVEAKLKKLVEPSGKRKRIVRPKRVVI
jgi:hypothetical protein